MRLSGGGQARFFCVAALVDFLYRIYEKHCHKFTNGVYYRDGKIQTINDNEVNDMADFELVAPFAPTGDQPQAIEALFEGLNLGYHRQTLLGVTGSGKTYTMANIIAKANRPALIFEPNKTLAAQLYSEFKAFFPNNAVEYFVSYYDYYQPEAYVASTDTYIEKDAQINETIEKLRHSATASLLERRDVIIIASVSCIYGLGSPEFYRNEVLNLRPGQEIERDDVLRKLIEIQYERNDMDFKRGTFRVRGDCVEVMPASSSERGIRIEFSATKSTALPSLITSPARLLASVSM